MFVYLFYSVEEIYIINKQKMKKKIIVTGSILALLLSASTFAMWNENDMWNENHRMWVKKEFLKEKRQAIREWFHNMHQQAKNFWTGHKQERIQLHKQFKDFHKKFKVKMDEDMNKLRKQMQELKAKFKTASKEEKQKLIEQMKTLHEQFRQKYAENLEPAAKAEFDKLQAQREQLKKQAQEFRQKATERYSLLKESLQQKINNILETKLFQRLSKLSKEKQVKVYERINKRVDTIISKIKQRTQTKRNQLRLQILQFIKDKVNEKLDNLKNDSVDIENTINEALWN